MSEIDWQELDISKLTNAEACADLSDILTKEMADIEIQLDLADARQAAGEQIDLFWYAKAKSALKHRGRIHQIIARRRGNLKRVECATQGWEYKQCQAVLGFDIGQLGLDGWELIAVVHHYSAQNPTLFFKRRIMAVTQD